MDLYKVVLYFETKYAFKRKYEKELVSDFDKLPSFLNENIFLILLLTLIIKYHISNNFDNFKRYNLKDGDISPTKSSPNSPLKKLFTNKEQDDMLDFDFKQDNKTSKRNGIVSPDKRTSIFPRIVDGKTITELRESFNTGKSFSDMKSNLNEDNLFSGKSMTLLITDDKLFTIASLNIHPDLFTSCRIFTLLDNLFDKLERIYTDIEHGLDENEKINKQIEKSGKSCDEYFKNNPICRWFGGVAQQSFTLIRYLESIHFVLYIYTINTVLYRPFEEDTFFYAKISKQDQEKFTTKFSKCEKKIIYNSKTKGSYMICDTSSSITTETSPYEKLSTFDGLLRLLSITHQMNNAI